MVFQWMYHCPTLLFLKNYFFFGFAMANPYKKYIYASQPKGILRKNGGNFNPYGRQESWETFT